MLAGCYQYRALCEGREDSLGLPAAGEDSLLCFEGKLSEQNQQKKELCLSFLSLSFNTRNKC